MPTQQEIEYFRMKHQKFTTFKLFYALQISFASNLLTAPLEFLKVRAQLLQEGRRLHGFGFDRGVPTFRVLNEVIDSGLGFRGLWKGADSLIARSLWYGGFRAYFWSLFYNYFNKDPRRTIHWTTCSFASFLGGFCAGVLANPVDIVYNRQVADGLYPKELQRGYRNFFDGLHKVHAEGALFRGAFASGVAYGMLNGSMSGIYDYLKEYCYWIFGPAEFLRPMILLPTVGFGIILYLPIDNIKVRYHTMTPLPNGEMPYKSFLETLIKVSRYEGSIFKYSSSLSFLSGGIPAFWRLFISLYIGILATDHAFSKNYREGELWQAGTVHRTPYQGHISHEPSYIDDYDPKLSPVKVNTRPETNISLGPGTNSYIKY